MNHTTSPYDRMTSAPIKIDLTGGDLQAAHDKAAQAISQLSKGHDIPEEDRRILQEFYNECVNSIRFRFSLTPFLRLEQRQALLGQDTDPDSEDDENDAFEDEEVKAKAVAFNTFLSSLDPNDPATRILIEANNVVTAALGNIQRGGSFLENAPMTQILDAYERAQSREEILKSNGKPVSMVNAAIYLSEATTLSEMVKMLIVLELDAPPTDVSLSQDEPMTVG
ncbi:hypothetical protein B0H17DRAFT_1097389 [Mycena rosella]|uniref:Uncharacterized protein n=1 Tax=Mycena rosella TaxID=1033263 RepID=A0AAD7G581_MYCRO|nr:hypothetical protein B0H17DRAFT_1097389 [Mycena rosella]